MRETNFFIKYLKNISNFINSLLEKNLNKLNFKNLTFLFKNNKIILTFVALFVLFISYLLLPTLYNQSYVVKELQANIQKKLEIDLKLSQNLRYNFFPKPHFIITEARVYDEQIEISKIEKLKIFVSVKNLFTPKNIVVKNLIFEKANFNLNKKNYNFFLDLLNNDFKDGSLTIKNSNIFFRNLNQDVLFINKILKMKYYYESKELKNIFYSSNKIFNIPFSTKVFFDENKSKIFSIINLDLMKLKIENELILNDNKKKGKSDFIFNKAKRSFVYEIEKNFFNFKIYDKIEEPSLNYDGKFNFKPFYSTLNGYLDEINLSYIFGKNSIISKLIKTEIFYNKNIDFKLNINADNVYKNENFNNINLNSKIVDGLIDADNTKFEWRNFADFELVETLIFIREGELILDGKLDIKVNNYNKIYKFFLTPKKYRKKINQIDLNFTYNFDKKVAELKDIKIDNKINKNVNKILNNVILKKDDFQNKIYLKNILNKAIKSYAG